MRNESTHNVKRPKPSTPKNLAALGFRLLYEYVPVFRYRYVPVFYVPVFRYFVNAGKCKFY